MKYRHLQVTLLVTTLVVAALPALAQQKAPQRPVPGAKTAQPPVTAAGTELEQKMEAKLGRPLTADQKQRISKATQMYNASTRAPHAKFVQDVARSVNQTEDVIAPMIPMNMVSTDGPEKTIVPKIEAKLNRKLAPVEVQRIKTLDDGRKTSLKVLQDNYARQLSAASGVPYPAVTEMLPK